MSLLSRPKLLAGAAGIILVVLAVVIWTGRSPVRTTDDAFVDGDILTISADTQGKVVALTVQDNAHVAQGAALLDLESDDLVLQLQAAQAAKAGADAQLDEVNAGGAIPVARRKAAEAAVQLATIRVAQAQLMLGKAHVTAPIAGTVAHRLVSAGDSVQAGQPLLALVADQRWITANLKETQLRGLKPGDAAEVTIDAFPDMKLKAHVESVQQGAGQSFNLLPAENASGNFVKVVQRVPVKLMLDTVPDRPLAPGLSARVSIHVR